MKARLYRFVAVFFLFCCGFLVVKNQTYAQSPLSNLRQKKLVLSADTLTIDTLSIVHNSLIIKDLKENILPDSLFVIDYFRARLSIKKQHIDRVFGLIDSSKTVVVSYRTFDFNFSKINFNKQKPQKTFERDVFSIDALNAFADDNAPFLDFGTLQKNGNISRGISFGNSQNVVFNSGLNLQLAGKLSDDIELLASINDNNVPFQPDGFTQSIQDFDRVFIQIKHPKHQLILGDFDITQPKSYFLNTFKNVKGIKIDNLVWQKKRSKTTQKDLQKIDSPPPTLRHSLSATSARGKFSRNVFPGKEGNQGPYRLQGNANEGFVVILAGSEKVFIDGELLKRGEQYDYVMNYNTADLIFTPNRLITNQSRIIVEFEYANQAFARTIVFDALHFESQRLKANFNYYNEGDLKNQPLFQTLNANQQRYLTNLGSDIQNVAYPSAEIDTRFKADSIQYHLIDSAGFRFFRIATDTNLAVYKVFFTDVGQGNGNYRQARTPKNGRIFEFIMPQIGANDTLKQGRYEPILRLVAPNRLQMATLGIETNATKHLKILTEVAYSNKQNNTFANQNTSQNRGFAAKIQIIDQREIYLPTVKKVVMKNKISLEQLTNNFNILQPYRNAEFARDWNLKNPFSGKQEQIVEVEMNLYKSPVNGLTYRFNRFSIANDYLGIKNFVSYQFNKNNFNVLITSDLNQINSNNFKGNFNKNKLQLSKNTKSLHANFLIERQRNRLLNPENDTLLASAFVFNILEASIGNADSSQRNFLLKYTIREDFLPQNKAFLSTQIGQNITLTSLLAKNNNAQLRLNITYRNVFIKPQNKQETHYLGQIEYNLRLWKQAINNTIFYNFGSGQELLRNFQFLKTLQIGQGTHSWVDFNGDGTAQLNEYVLNYTNTGDYIRVLVPSSEFVRTFSNQFNQTLAFVPAKIWRNKPQNRFQKIANRFSTLSAFSIDRKTQNDNPLNYLNPFELNIDDLQLISTNSSIRNAIFFNKNNPKLGIDLNFIQNFSKNSQINGFSSRISKQNNLKLRYSFENRLNTECVFKQIDNAQTIEFFKNNDFQIKGIEVEPALDWTYKQRLRLSVQYSYTRKENVVLNPNGIAEKIENHRITGDILFNTLEKTLIKTNVSVVKVDFVGNTNSLVSYELLQGFQQGLNFVWSVNISKVLANNLQINIGYDGRKSEGLPFLHIGKVQGKIVF